MNGILNVYKEKGYTSHDVVAKLRGILHEKKIGHTGTLDPDAVGVLPVCVGKATKVCDILTDRDKTYTAVVCLGMTTDTLDMSGEVQQVREVRVSEEDIRKALGDFRGEITQIPPMYSAVKVNGKRLYELARKGQEVERRERRVTIHELILQSVNLEDNEFSLEVSCSKGTYIRSLCHDIGQKLGCGAVMKDLVRTRVGQFRIEEAKKLQEIEDFCRCQDPASLLQPIDSVFSEFPSGHVAEAAMKYLRNGNLLARRCCHRESAKAAQGDEWRDGENVRMYGSDGEFYAIYRYDERNQRFRIVKMFHE